MAERFRAPYPYFGGKAAIADAVWQRLGTVRNVVDPFFGSGALMLGRPGWTPVDGVLETANDADGMVANFWRAVQAEPEQVAHYADWPVNENDLSARHIWLVNRKPDLVAQLEGDADYYDAKAAGWWVWGMACWIGGGFCSGNGPWHSVDGRLVRAEADGQGVQRRLVHLRSGMGVQRQRVHLGNGSSAGTGEAGLYAWMQALCDRMKRVRVCCGDWSRVCGPTPTTHNGITAVLLDPPYSTEASRDMNLYAHDSGTVAHDVRAWCIEHEDDPMLRIALCGYSGEGHDVLEERGWSVLRWQAHGGYSRQAHGGRSDNHTRECVWFSPHCPALETRTQLTMDDLLYEPVL